MALLELDSRLVEPTEAKLLPCPECECVDVELVRSKVREADTAPEFRVRCLNDKCQIQGRADWSTTAAEAIERWNRTDEYGRAFTIERVRMGCETTAAYKARKEADVVAPIRIRGGWADNARLWKP